MPKIDADGCPIHVEVSGSDSAPALMLSNSLGTNLHMWDDQVGDFAKHFRVIRYDRRGHGGSGVPQGPYSMERFGRDVLSVLDYGFGSLEILPVHGDARAPANRILIRAAKGGRAPTQIHAALMLNDESGVPNKGVQEILAGKAHLPLANP